LLLPAIVQVRYSVDLWQVMASGTNLTVRRWQCHNERVDIVETGFGFRRRGYRSYVHPFDIGLGDVCNRMVLES